MVSDSQPYGYQQLVSYNNSEIDDDEDEPPILDEKNENVVLMLKEKQNAY